MSESFRPEVAPTAPSTASRSGFNRPRFPRLAAFMLAMAAMSGCDDTRTHSGSDGDSDTTIDCSDPDNYGRCDFDEDGFQGDEECDDFDPTVYPGAPEIPYDGVDQNCDGLDLTDVDGEI